MAQNQQLDTYEFPTAALPYIPLLRQLDDSPRLISGTNTWAKLSGVLAKRPGFSLVSSAPQIQARPDRMVIYETLDNPSFIYLLASLLTAPNTWQMYWIRLDAGTPAWTSMGTYRAINASTRPHEIVISRGLAFIKGYPSAASGENLGTVIFDGSGGSPVVRPWGVLGPTKPAQAGVFGASAHNSNVYVGWTYAYAWVSVTGQVSNRSPIQTDPSQPKSFTGPLTNTIPKVTYWGTSDTVNFPYVNIYRTTDGGGTFYFLDQVANPGNVSATYNDNKGSSFGDPLPDTALDTSRVAPSLTSNSPPPTVNAPKVVGVDTPVASTPIVSFAGRLWFAIGNVVYFSGQEEIYAGVPEECWPSGFTGNFFRLPHPVRNLIAAKEALYVITSQDVYWVLGSSLDTFSMKILFTSRGGPPNQPRAITSIGDTAVWMTSDYRILAASGTQQQFLSDPLGKDLANGIAAATNPQVQITPHGDTDKDWLVVNLVDQANSANNKTWVYDFNLNQWNAPWVCQAASLVSGIYRETDSRRRLIAGLWDSGSNKLNLGMLDETVGTDYAPATGTNAGFAVNFSTGLLRVPGGNHVNLLRRPALSPAIHAVLFDRTKFAGDTDPAIQFVIDDFNIPASTPVSIVPPPRHSAPANYVQRWAYMNKAGQRVSVTISKTASAEMFEMQNLGVAFEPDGGA
jgi:hypothetical protein